MASSGEDMVSVESDTNEELAYTDSRETNIAYQSMIPRCNADDEK